MDENLIKQLQDSNARVRRASAYKIGKTKDPAYIPYLIKAYDDADGTVKLNVTDALKTIGTEEALQFLRADAAGKTGLKEAVIQQDNKNPRLFIEQLDLNREGLNTLLARMSASSPEEKGLLEAELVKMFGARALEWWEALAKDREIILGHGMARLVIPTPTPGNLGAKLAVAGAIGMLTGNINAGALAASSAGNMVLNDKIKFPAVCNLCGVNPGTHYKSIVKEVVFSEVGNMLGGPLMGQSKVELRVPVCAWCSSLKMAPGVFLESYAKEGNVWKLTLQVANRSAAEQYVSLNPGSETKQTAAELEAASAPPVQPLQAPEQRPGMAPAQTEQPGTIEIYRKSKMTGSMYKVKVSLDGRQVGELGGNQTVKFSAAAGAHALHVAGGGLSRTVNITVAAGGTMKFQTEFSEWGAMGGGLKLDALPPGK